nr:sugar transferase [Spirochaetota bacterium]
MLLFVLADFFILISAYIISRYLVFAGLFLDSLSIKEFVIFLFLTFSFFIVLERIEFSQPYRFRSLTNIIVGIILYELFIISIFYLFILLGIFDFNNRFVFFYVTITFFIFLSERIFVKLFLTILRKNGFNYKRYLIIGAGNLGLNFYRKVVSSDELGIKIVGFLDDDKDIKEKEDPAYTEEIKKLILGPTDLIETALMSRLVDNVIIALPMKAEDKIIKLANICEKHGAKAELIPDYYRIISEHPSVRIIKGYPLIGIRNVPLENVFNRLTKRIFDIVFSIPALIFLSPFFLIIMILIKTTAKGPVFFRQKRTGYDQKEFNII